MKNKICSNSHFNRLLKSFSKNFLKHIQTDKYLEVYKDSWREFYYGQTDDIQGMFFTCLILLEKSFKYNPYKTKSCFCDENEIFFNNYSISEGSVETKIWISYSIEDENCKRVLNNDFKDKFIVFKVYIKINNHRKKRIFRWKVKMDWIK